MNRSHKYHVDRIMNTSATLIADPRHKCHVDHEPTSKVPRGLGAHVITATWIMSHVTNATLMLEPRGILS